jgi:hypothetical protein
MSRLLLPIALLLFLALQACQEVYVHDSLDSDKKIPVVEGLINNSLGPHAVHIYYARPYTEKVNQPISKANVFVTDDAGSSYTFEEAKAGTYLCPYEILEGKPGHFYTLHAELPDGTIIESDQQMMPDTIDIEDTYQKSEFQEYVNRTYDNDIIVKRRFGTSTYVLLGDNFPDKRFYRIVSKYSAHLYYSSINLSYYYDVIDGDSVEFEVITDSIFDCVYTYSNNSITIPGIIDPAAEQSESARTRLSYFWPSDIQIADPKYQILEDGVTTQVYSISREVYDYYVSVADQLNAPSHLFDPVPTQLQGNLHCMSNPDQEILGLFEVSAYSLRQAAWLYEDHDCIDIVIADTFRIVPYE